MKTKTKSKSKYVVGRELLLGETLQKGDKCLVMGEAVDVTPDLFGKKVRFPLFFRPHSIPKFYIGQRVRITATMEQLINIGIGRPSAKVVSELVGVLQKRQKERWLVKFIDRRFWIDEKYLKDETQSAPTGIEREVCDDIFERQQKGILKYGTTVAENPLCLKEWLQHAYLECLDQAIYLKRAMREIKSDES